MKKIKINKNKLKEYPKWTVGYGNNSVEVNYPENPREGICDACGRSLDKKQITVTQLHHWCFLGDSMVLTDRGYREIKELICKNSIVSHRGIMQEVNDVGNRKTNIIMEISATGILPIKCTPEHEFYVATWKWKWKGKGKVGSERKIMSYSWKQAEDINDKDLFLIPRYKREIEVTNIDLTPYIERRSSNVTRTEFPLTPDTAWLLGIYLAEGSATVVPTFTLNKNEDIIFHKIQKIFKDLGYSSSIRFNDHNGLVVTTFSSILARFFKDIMGTNATNKHIPDFIFFNKDDEIVKQFILGFFEGDGHFEKKRGSVYLSTASKQLALQLQMLMTSFGLYMNLMERPKQTSFIRGTKIYSNELYQVHSSCVDVIHFFGKNIIRKRPTKHYVVLDNYIGIKIKGRRFLEGDFTVYNCSVEEDMSYTINNIAVHNSYQYKMSTLKKEPLKVLENLSELCYSCFPEKTYISNCIIPRYIEDVDDKTLLLSQEGKQQEVVEKFSREYSGELITIKGRGLLPFSCTPEHPILITNRKVKQKQVIKNGKKTTDRTFFFEPSQWVEAKDIVVPKSMNSTKILDDYPYLVFPKYKNETSFILDLKQYGNNYCDIKEKIPLTEEMAELFGLYLAEGCSSLNKRSPNTKYEVGTIHWSFNKKEVELIERTRYLLKSVFNKESNITKRTSVTEVYTCSVQLSRFLYEQFGHLARNKQIPLFIMDAPKNIVRAFVLGYLKGDGYLYLKKNTISFITASPKIALQLQKLLSKLDIFSNVFLSKQPNSRITYIKGREITTHGEYHITIHGPFIEKLGFKCNSKLKFRYYGEDENNFYIPIKKINIEYYKGLVHNFETQDHTYQVSNILVHNCHKIADALRELLTLKKERLISIIYVGLLMPDEMKEKLDWVAKAWINVRRKDRKRNKLEDFGIEDG